MENGEVIYEQIHKNELSANGRGITSLIEYYKGVSDKASCVFQNFFRNKNEIEVMRRSLNLLDKYHFVLHLPSSINQSIQKAEVLFHTSLSISISIYLSIYIYISIYLYIYIFFYHLFIYSSLSFSLSSIPIYLYLYFSFTSLYLIGFLLLFF